MCKKQMLIDITYELSEILVAYPGNPLFFMRRVREISRGETCNITEINISSHTGTHIDAPLHWIHNGQDISNIPLERLNGKVRVIELKGDSVTVDFLKPLDIQKGERLIFKTSNTTIFTGKEILLDYVTLEYESAAYLAEKEISLVGIDYMTIELPKNKRQTGQSIHKTLLSNNIYILEMLDLSNVTEGVYELVCMPLKLKGCDGSPVRAVLKTIE